MHFSSLREAAALPLNRPHGLLHWYKDSASGQITVTFQQTTLPLCQGTSVRPSGRFLSDLNRPVGSLVTVKPAEANPRAIRSFWAWCLAVLPAALADEAVHPWASTRVPQWHRCGTHGSSPSLKLTATRRTALSFNPHDAIGTANSDYVSSFQISS